jgi:phage terminase Nu1 subunit (DNA packaging protein)
LEVEIVMVSATRLAEHLGVSRVYVVKLATDGVISKRPDGKFNQDAARIAYIKWLRDPARRAARSEAQSEFVKAKTHLIQLKIAQQEGLLMEVADCDALIDEICGLMRTGLSGLAARVTRDLQVRRTIDSVIHEILTEISVAAARRADGCEAKEL